MASETVSGQILFGVEQAARVLGISPRLLWLYIAEGQIPIRKIGARTLVHRKSLEHFAARDHGRPETVKEEEGK